MDVVGDRPSTIVKDDEAEIVRNLFANFLETFVVDFSEGPHYVAQIAVMHAQLGTSLYINFDHLKSFEETLAERVESEYYRFEPYLRMATASVVKNLLPEYVTNNNGTPKEFWVHFYNLPSVLRLRELRTARIGRLVSVCGTVTRTSEVRPELLFGTFQCLDCQTKINDVEQRFKYTEPMKCKNPVCVNTARWQLDLDGSKFVDWQKVRVQENANEIPSGAMPRTLEVILRQDAVEKAKAGDRCVFTGTLIVVPDLSAMRLPGAVQTVREISKNRDIGEGEDIRDDQMDEEEMQAVAQQFTEEERKRIFQMRKDPHLYTNLVQSVAPSIYGHEEVKKGILLMLFGGVHKETREGIRLRGDINVCVIGDPSVAKSQFLKYVTGIVPRSVYTAGKASSAAGLTATVVKDMDTGEFNIEAGALMLADNGICCIDEFDKMDPADQVAIHEAMEQQTISIAKAGIHATLNARTSILAAANPIGGRYDRTKSLRANITITAPIMSRFDLMFVVLDKNDPILDEIVANHIVAVHQRKEKALTAKYSTADIQRYIKLARSLKPQMTPEAQQRLIEEYCRLRMSDQGRGKTAWRITVRQLESLIRLSEALARLHLEPMISIAFVDEAARLLRQSIVNIQMEDVELLEPPPVHDDVAAALQGHGDGGNDGDDDNMDTDDGPAGGAAAPKRQPRSRSAAQSEDAAGAEDEEPIVRPAKRAKIEKRASSSLQQSLPQHEDSLSTGPVREPEPSLEATQPLEPLPEQPARSTSKKPIQRKTTKRETEDPDDPAMKQRDLVKQYLDSIAGELQSEQALKDRRDIVRAAIQRLIDKDKLLRVIPSAKKQDKEERLLVVDADRRAHVMGTPEDV